MAVETVKLSALEAVRMELDPATGHVNFSFVVGAATMVKRPFRLEAADEMSQKLALLVQRAKAAK